MTDKNFIKLMKVLDDCNLSEESKDIFKDLAALMMKFYLSGQRDCIKSLQKK